MVKGEHSIDEAGLVTLRAGDVEGSLGRIDQYMLVRELGSGGFGTVYLAKDAVSGVEYAVKGLPPMVRVPREIHDTSGTRPYMAPEQNGQYGTMPGLI